MKDNIDASFGIFDSSSQVDGEFANTVTDEDLEHLSQLVDGKDSGPAWIPMMDRSTPAMSYQAWRRDPDVGFSVVILYYSVSPAANYFFTFPLESMASTFTEYAYIQIPPL